jgi:hypothetical protein
VVKRQFGLDEATTDKLVAEAIKAEHEAVDLYHFTSLINRSLDEHGRRHIVEMMWEIVYADGRVTEFENNVMWRAADLLGVSQRERIEVVAQLSDTVTEIDLELLRPPVGKHPVRRHVARLDEFLVTGRRNRDDVARGFFCRVTVQVNFHVWDSSTVTS